MPKFCPKVPITTRTYIWIYRILFITFGGVWIDSNGNLTVNKYLKYVGYFGFIVMTIPTILGYIYTRYSLINALSDSESFTTYYIICSTTLMQILHISVDLWYLNRNGIISVVKLSQKYKLLN
jgi:hypothetical protein